MHYSDEQIISRRRLLNKQDVIDISTPNLPVGGEVLNFVRTELFDKFLSALLPKEYGDMPTDKIKIKYPMDGRPQIIKTSADMVVNFCFSKYGPFDQKFTPIDVEKATKMYFGAIRKAYPSNQFHMREVENDRGYFAFTSPGLDQNIYQLQAFLSIKERFIHFIFNAPDAFSASWNSILPQVVASIQAIR